MAKTKYFQKHKIYRKLMLFIPVLILGAAAGFFAVKALKLTPAPAPEKCINCEKKITKTVKKSEKDSADDKIPFSKTPIQNEGEDPNSSPKITGSISRAQVVNGVLTVRVAIDQFLQSAGTCTIVLTKNGVAKTFSVPTIANPSSSSCEGFDLPVEGNFTSGLWSINLTVQAGDKTGIITGEVQIL